MPQNEDLLTLPDDWRATLHPRRGGAPGPPLELAPDAAATVQQWVKETRDQIDHLLGNRRSRPDLVEPARAHLEGKANPQGADGARVVRRRRDGAQAHAGGPPGSSGL
ncbi:hypothetical protein ACGFNU_31375 [Spirillospora sp. NPDC048911]|uniref:hypothetical protein n=1 Tax=Spirillospora sp. NPDC048911 TaxID=3364527 RepID=UPI003714E7A8